MSAILLVRVRGRDAFAKAHVPGALCAPLPELQRLSAQLPLAGSGFLVKELNVGWEEWSARRLPTHSQRVLVGELRCSCSDELHAPEHQTV